MLIQKLQNMLIEQVAMNEWKNTFNTIKQLSQTLFSDWKLILII